MAAGEFSAAKTGTVTSFNPMPTPRSTRQIANSHQSCVVADPRGARTEKIAATKIVPLRPMKLLKGSEIHAVLQRRVRETIDGLLHSTETYKKAMAIYGHELTNPISHVRSSQLS